MKWLKLLGLSFPGSFWIYVAIAVAVFAAGTATGIKAKAILDAPVISKAKQETAEAQKDLEHLNALVARADAGQERVRADENLKAANETANLQAKVIELEAKKANSDKAATDQHQQLLKALANAPKPTTQTSLDPSLRAYADKLRDIQTHDAGGNSAPP